jgi:hypothetical protein
LLHRLLQGGPRVRPPFDTIPGLTVKSNLRLLIDSRANLSFVIRDQKHSNQNHTTPYKLLRHVSFKLNP